jgi:hypothetical protein
VWKATRPTTHQGNTSEIVVVVEVERVQLADATSESVETAMPYYLVAAVVAVVVVVVVAAAVEEEVQVLQTDR